MKHWWKDNDWDKKKYREKDLSHRHFIHHKAKNDCPEVKPEPPRQQTDDWTSPDIPNLALYWVLCVSSPRSRFTHGENASGSNRIGGQVGPKVGLEYEFCIIIMIINIIIISFMQGIFTYIP